jgi:hypothetical protein
MRMTSSVGLLPLKRILSNWRSPPLVFRMTIHRITCRVIPLTRITIVIKFSNILFIFIYFRINIDIIKVYVYISLI